MLAIVVTHKLPNGTEDGNDAFDTTTRLTMITYQFPLEFFDFITELSSSYWSTISPVLFTYIRSLPIHLQQVPEKWRGAVASQ